MLVKHSMPPAAGAKPVKTHYRGCANNPLILNCNYLENKKQRSSYFLHFRSTSLCIAIFYKFIVANLSLPQIQIMATVDIIYKKKNAVQ